MNVQLSAELQGHVQGVGFRYSTREIASQFAVTGYVKNNPDGTVSLVAEGEKKELQALLKAVQDRFASNIGDTNLNWYPASGNYQKFDIAY